MSAKARPWLVLPGAIALSLSVSACASTASAPRPFPMPAPPPLVERPVPDAPLPPAEPDTPEGASAAERLVAAALQLRGAPYRNGGADPRGFDCSGFTQYVFAQVGTRLPRETRDQFRLGEQVERGDLQRGDLIFFTTAAERVSHVGIALGDDRFVHAPSSRGVVRVESLELPYWKRRLVGIRRVSGR